VAHAMTSRHHGVVLTLDPEGHRSGSYGYKIGWCGYCFEFPRLVLFSINSVATLACILQFLENGFVTILEKFPIQLRESLREP